MAQLRRTLLSLEHSTSLGRAVCIAWVERSISLARSRTATASEAAGKAMELLHGLPQGIFARLNLSGHKGHAELGSSMAQLRRTLLSLEHSTSLGRAVCIAWVERSISLARSRTLCLARLEGRFSGGGGGGGGGGGKQTVVEYTATMTIGSGHGTHTLDICIRREKALADVHKQKLCPKALEMLLPFKVDGKPQRLYLPMKVVRQRADGTFALVEGMHQLKSKFDNGDMIDVRVSRTGPLIAIRPAQYAIDVAAARAAVAAAQYAIDVAMEVQV